MKTKAKTEQRPDVAAQARRLREQTCSLLGLDVSTLTPAQLVRVDRASVLRLRLSDLEAMQLNGAAFDALEYVAVSEQYEKLLNLNHAVMMEGDAGFEAARAQMRQLLACIAPELADVADDDAEPEHQQALEEPEPSEPEPPPRAAAQPAPALPSNVQYLSTRRQPDGRPPAHYLKQDRDTFDVPYFPLPKDHR
jgi:hypothetical protein